MEGLKRLIASGEYRPGDRIPSEAQLASMFGVGRSSIREAIKVFQYLGVLESSPGSGTVLAGQENITTEALTWSVLLADQTMYEVLELRELIELRGISELKTKLAAGESSAAETISRLSQLVADMWIHTRSANSRALANCDYEFHLAIVRATGNSLFEAIFNALHSFTVYEIGRSYYAIEDLEEVARDHEEMLLSIRGWSRTEAVNRHAAHFRRIKALLEQSQE
jgi:DNA-binding FadR family transcriptional regulator